MNDDQVIVGGLHISGLRQLKKSGVITLRPHASGMTGTLEWAVDLETLARMSLGDRFRISASASLFPRIDTSGMDPSLIHRVRE